MLCPNCDMENADDAVECRRCRAPFQTGADAEAPADQPAEVPADQAMSSGDLGEVCRECETFNPPGVHVCINCGRSLVSGEHAGAEAAGGAAPAEPAASTAETAPVDDSLDKTPAAAFEGQAFGDDRGDVTQTDPHDLGPPKPAPATPVSKLLARGPTPSAPHAAKVAAGAFRAQGAAHSTSPGAAAGRGPSAKITPAIAAAPRAPASVGRAGGATGALAKAGPAAASARAAGLATPGAKPAPVAHGSPRQATPSAPFRAPGGGRTPAGGVKAPTPAAAAPPAGDKTCGSCGAVNPPASKFCSECGTPFPRGAPAHAAPSVTPKAAGASAGEEEQPTDPSQRRVAPKAAGLNTIPTGLAAEVPQVFSPAELVPIEEPPLEELEAGAAELVEESGEPIAEAAAPRATPEAPPAAEPEPVVLAAEEEAGEAAAPAEAEPEAPPAAEAGMEPAPFDASLVVERGAEAGSVLLLERVENTLGTGDSSIALTGDPHVAPKHATLLFADEKLWLRDEGAVNGVYFRLREPAPLQPGDRFIVGQRLLRFDGPVELEVGEPTDPPMQGTPRQSGQVVRLVELLSGGREGRICHRTGPVIAVGKTGCELNFPSDSELATRHAELQMSEDGTVQLADVSGHGVFLRMPAQASIELQADDVFQVGEHVFRLETA
jgi:ribosomal protein L40E